MDLVAKVQEELPTVIEHNTIISYTVSFQYAKMTYLVNIIVWLVFSHSDYVVIDSKQVVPYYFSVWSQALTHHIPAGR